MCCHIDLACICASLFRGNVNREDMRGTSALQDQIDKLRFSNFVPVFLCVTLRTPQGGIEENLCGAT